jgi:Tc5 transposase DNA-binding domain
VAHDSGTAVYRARQPQWPILELILYNWHQIIERRGGLLTGDLIITKAQQIWPQIPRYQSKLVPAFSSGWLDKFKRRHNIQKVSRHGEAGSVPTKAVEDMRAVQTLCGDYSEEDIYGMDETGLFWRMAPSSGLASEKRAGVKKYKARITLVVCTNFTGSH